MDWVDELTQSNQRIDDAALAAQLARHNFNRPSLAQCECGEAIPKVRQAMGGVTRCSDCQVDFDKRQRAYQHRPQEIEF